MRNEMILPEPKQFVLSVLQIGYEKCDKKHFYGPSKRGFFILHTVVDGAGIFRVKGKTTRIKRGDIFLVTPNDETFWQADHDNPYEYYWIAFHGTGVKRILQNAGFLNNDVYVQNLREKFDEVKEIMRQMVELKHPSSKNDLIFVSGFYKILSMLTEEKQYEYTHISNSIYERINLYLEVNYMYDISMDNFSYYTGLHRSSIYRFFEREYGKSPTEYIRDFRLSKALSILENTDMPINAVAISCGFNDMSYFSKIFKNKYGFSPGEARKKNGEKSDF